MDIYNMNASLQMILTDNAISNWQHAFQIMQAAAEPIH